VPAATTRAVFYSDNARVRSQELAAAIRAITSRHLTPEWHVNVRRAARSSNVDRQIRNSFFQAAAICLFFRPTGIDWFNITDHWVIAELVHVQVPCFIYLAPTVAPATERMLAGRASATCNIRRMSASDDIEVLIIGDLASVGL
jgi:hypothetical protein